MIEYEKLKFAKNQDGLDYYWNDEATEEIVKEIIGCIANDRLKKQFAEMRFI